MLTFEDCLGLSELTEGEILAVAEHENIPELAALELGNYLIHTPSGERKLKHIFLDRIAAARKAGDVPHAVTLKLVLRRYCQEHHV